MLLLDLSSSCTDPAVALMAKIMHTIFTMVQIIGPIVCIVVLTLDILKIVTASDEKDVSNIG